MDRPYIVCHILSALDGKIAGTFAGTKAAQSASEEYARIRSAYQAEAWLYGTTTTKEFTHYRKPVLESVCENLPEGDYIAEGSLSDGSTLEMSIFTEQADLEAVIAMLQGLDYVDSDGCFGWRL